MGSLARVESSAVRDKLLWCEQGCVNIRGH